MSETKPKGGQMQFPIICLLICLSSLKLGGEIDWSWWLVFAPFWVPVVAGLILATVVGIIHCMERGE